MPICRCSSLTARPLRADPSVARTQFLEQVQLAGARHGLGAAADAQLAVDALDVRANRRYGSHEFFLIAMKPKFIVNAQATCSRPSSRRRGTRTGCAGGTHSFVFCKVVTIRDLPAVSQNNLWASRQLDGGQDPRGSGPGDC
jgi:hypothetical protein